MKRIPNFAGFVKTLALWRSALHASRSLCLACCLAWVCAVSARANPGVVLGDYDAEPRTGAHVDTDRLVRRLGDLGANTYMWLIWHNTNDWEDLKVFLPKAGAAGITVWVYLVPHSETAAQDAHLPYSEPFRLDYIRWAEEIARLSLQYTNLTGYVIDDFWANVRPDRFTSDYIRRMVAAGKATNPKLKFYPLMYFYEIDERFLEVLAPLVDGVVAAYPFDRAEVEEALTFLEDGFRPGTARIAFPGHTQSQPGDRGFVSQEARVSETTPPQLSFHYRDSFNGPTAGYHRLQVRVDHQVVWDEDVAGYDDDTVTVDLAEAVKGKWTVRLGIGAFDLKGVGNFGFEVAFSKLRVQGLQLKDMDLGHGGAWSQEVAGAFAVQSLEQHEATGRLRLPLIVMPAGDQGEYEMRYHEAGTPENIAGRVKMLTDLAREGRIEGVVVYCLDKRDGSAQFEAVRKVFESAGAPAK